MFSLSPQENQIVDNLRLAYYKVVPSEFRTYCSLTSRITSAVLTKLGVKNELMPCQLWYSTQTQNYVVGFLDSHPANQEWNGHVVCRAGDVIIDAATQNLEVKLGLKVPWLVVAKRFLVSTQLISRARLNNEAMLEWFYPPGGQDLSPPEEPAEIVQLHAEALFHKIAETSTS